ncbi:hypothetical protein ACFX11_011975 [Malus domestica]
MKSNTCVPLYLPTWGTVLKSRNSNHGRRVDGLLPKSGQCDENSQIGMFEREANTPPPSAPPVSDLVLLDAQHGGAIIV